MGLDTRVWLSLLIVFVMSCLLLGFRLATKQHCSSFKIEVKGYNNTKPNSYFMGAQITFTAQMPGGGDVIWDFGDHSAKKSGVSVAHTFTAEGNYLVTATVNGQCTETVNINIQQLPQAAATVTTTAEPANPISGPDAPQAAMPINYSCSAPAGSYEWSVVNSPDFPTQKGNIATFTFPTEGSRIIELKLDNDPSKVYRKTIQVLPAAKLAENNPMPSPAPQPVVAAPPPPADKPEVKDNTPKVLVIPDEEFKSMFDQVTDGKKDALAFNQFLCSGIQTKVLANDTEWETVASFCSKIYNHKKITIKSVTTVRDEKKCVTIIKVSYKKRWI
jgi:PKD repeat protein